MRAMGIISLWYPTETTIIAIIIDTILTKIGYNISQYP